MEIFKPVITTTVYIHLSSCLDLEILPYYTVFELSFYLAATSPLLKEVIKFYFLLLSRISAGMPIYKRWFALIGTEPESAASGKHVLRLFLLKSIKKGNFELFCNSWYISIGIELELSLR